MSKYLTLIIAAVMLSACQPAPSGDTDQTMEKEAPMMKEEKQEVTEEEGEMMDDATESEDEVTEEPEVMEEEEQAVEEETMEEETSEAEEVNVEEEASQGRYEAYSAEVAAATEGQRKALFFHADWCPKCKQLDASLLEVWDSMPEGAIVLKVNYDDSDELKSEYGVVAQDTIVFLNPDGSVAKMTMGATPEMIAEFFES